MAATKWPPGGENAIFDWAQLEINFVWSGLHIYQIWCFYEKNAQFIHIQLHAPRTIYSKPQGTTTNLCTYFPRYAAFILYRCL